MDQSNPEEVPPRVKAGLALKKLLDLTEEHAKGIYDWLQNALSDRRFSTGEAHRADELGVDLLHVYRVCQIWAHELCRNELPFDQRSAQPKPPGPWGDFSGPPDQVRSRQRMKLVTPDPVASAPKPECKGTAEESVHRSPGDAPQVSAEPPKWAVDLKAAGGKPRGRKRGQS